jgi:arsenite methyltransferase
MSAPESPPITGPLRAPLEELLAGGGAKACCAAVYEHPVVRWLLGAELHPGGEATTKRALELIGVGPGDRLLDVASGTGTSAMLAAREFGCLAAGLDYGEEAVCGAQEAADAAGLCDRVGFIVGDAEALPFADGEFDAVLCECSLCTFPNKARAMAEVRRVLRPGGQLAICDVIVDRSRLPAELDGAWAAIACIGEALSRPGYEDLLAAAGLHPFAVELRDEDALAMASRVQDRLRGARLLGYDWVQPSLMSTDDAIELSGAALQAISEGALGYAIFATRG